MATRGFGLIEVMISASMLAVGMTAMLSLNRQLNDTNQHQKLLGHALHVGESSVMQRA